MEIAFKTQDIDVARVPPWVNLDTYDVDALPDHPISAAEVPLALKFILEDRFKLLSHVASRQIFAHVLRAEGRSAHLMLATPRAENERWGILQSGTTITARDVAMTDFVDKLSLMIGQPVADQTGFSARYDFTLELNGWALGDRARTSSDGLVGNEDSLSSALETQLGLKLLRMNMAKSIVVVDHIEKASGN